MKKLIYFTAIVTSITIFHSCKKQEVIPPPVPTSSIRDSLLFNYTERFQSFIVNGATGGSYTSDQGVKYHFPYYAFRDATGDTIFGNVQVDFVEILDPSGMILTNKPMTALNEPLVSHGEIKIDFSVNGNPVYISEDTNYYVNIPVDEVDQNVLLFDGTVDATDYIDWSHALTDDGNLIAALSTSEIINNIPQLYDSLILSSKNGSWISSSHTISSISEKAKISLTLPELHNNSNTLFFVHFDQHRAVVPGYFDGTNFVTPATIPGNEAVTIVVFSEIDDNYYSTFIPDVKIGGSYAATIAPNPTTYADLINTIVNL